MNWEVGFMKRIVAILIVLAFMCMASSSLAAGTLVYVDGEPVSSVALEVKNSVTFVPLSFVSEELGARADYYDYDGEILITNFDNAYSSLHLAVGKQQAELSGHYHLEGNVNDPAMWEFLAKPENQDLAAYVKHLDSEYVGGDFLRTSHLQLPAAPYLQNGTVMVPLRFIAEQAGCVLDYTNGRIEITRAAVDELDGQRIFGLHFTGPYRDELVEQKDIIYRCARLVQECRGGECSQPENVATLHYQGYLYEFNNSKGQAVAAWQFYVPAAEAEKVDGWSALYLHDVMRQKWYMADRTVYEEYFYGSGNLEPLLNSVNVKLP